MKKIVMLNQDTPEIQYLCSRDKRLAKVISMVGSISYVHQDNVDGYAFLVHEIIEQMLSVKAASKIYSRLEELCLGNICPEAIATLSTDELRSTGTSSAKAEYIQNVTSAVQSDKLRLSDLCAMDDSEVIRQLTAIRGIGSWTAKMYLLFVLHRPDILPFEDGAFLQSYRWMYKTTDCSPAAIIKKCKKWRPYSSIAARYLYEALDLGYTKNSFHLYK